MLFHPFNFASSNVISVFNNFSTYSPSAFFCSGVFVGSIGVCDDTDCGVVVTTVGSGFGTTISVVGVVGLISVPDVGVSGVEQGEPFLTVDFRKVVRRVQVDDVGAEGHVRQAGAVIKREVP